MRKSVETLQRQTMGENNSRKSPSGNLTEWAIIHLNDLRQIWLASRMSCLSEIYCGMKHNYIKK